MELPDALHARIERLSSEGNDLLDQGKADAAILKWTQALDLLPEPRHDWEAYTWLKASLGDASFAAGDHAAAREALLDALNGPGGPENPFVHYRLGECELNLGHEKAAIERFLKAYMLDGEDIFLAEDDGPNYLRELKDQGLVD